MNYLVCPLLARNRWFYLLPVQMTFDLLSTVQYYPTMSPNNVIYMVRDVEGAFCSCFTQLATSDVLRTFSRTRPHALNNPPFYVLSCRCRSRIALFVDQWCGMCSFPLEMWTRQCCRMPLDGRFVYDEMSLGQSTRSSLKLDVLLDTCGDRFQNQLLLANHSTFPLYVQCEIFKWSKSEWLVLKNP